MNWKQIMLSSCVSSCVEQSVTGASCGGLGVFEAVAGSLSMVEVASDGNVFGVDPQGNLLQRWATKYTVCSESLFSLKKLTIVNKKLIVFLSRNHYSCVF